MYIGPYDYKRFPLKPLTADIARQFGHVAWIETDDPVEALRQMNESVKTAPFNVAVWPHAVNALSAEDRTAIKEWRNNGHDLEIRPAMTAYPTMTAVKNALSKEFGKVAANTPPGILKRHITGRMQLFKKALNPEGYRFHLRANKTTTDSFDGHVDGSLFGNSTRFLEAIESPATCIIANNDVINTAGRYRIRDPYNTIHWQLPENSLVLITKDLHHCQPVFHAQPPTPQGEEPIKRTVCVYNMNL